MKKVQVLNNQTLQDLCIQLYGTTNVVHEIALDNDISITETLEIGTILNVPDVSIENADIVRFYDSNDIKPATSATLLNQEIIQENNPCDYCKYFK